MKVRLTLPYMLIVNNLNKNMEQKFFKHGVSKNIHHLLCNYHVTRDSDLLLISMYYQRYCPEPIQYITGIELLKHMTNKELPSPELITRTRRKIQELHPELRGKNYQYRQNRSKKIQSTINKETL